MARSLPDSAHPPPTSRIPVPVMWAQVAGQQRHMQRRGSGGGWERHRHLLKPLLCKGSHVAVAKKKRYKMEPW